MSTSHFTDAYETIMVFQNSILSSKPTLPQMISEIYLMQFKVRPVTGNITAIDFKNEKLIDTLWTLGKLDQFAKDAVKKIPQSEQDIFLHLVNELKGTYQQELSKIQLAGDASGSEAPVFEAEIYKDTPSKVN